MPVVPDHRPLDGVQAAPIDPGFLLAMQTRVESVSSAHWYRQSGTGFVRATVAGAAPAEAEATATVPKPVTATAGTDPSPTPTASNKPVFFEQRPKGFTKVRVGGEEGELRKKEGLARIRSKSEHKKEEKAEVAPCTTNSADEPIRMSNPFTQLRPIPLAAPPEMET